MVTRFVRRANWASHSEIDDLLPTAGRSVTPVHPIRDHYLPPDPEAFRHAEPTTGRIIVIAPTRAACETIELAMHLHIGTVLERDHGDEIRELARRRVGFGIVAGTGTGKTLAIRSIAEETVGLPLKVGVVNREREATPETPSWNVVIVTTEAIAVMKMCRLKNELLRSEALRHC